MQNSPNSKYPPTNLSASAACKITISHAAIRLGSLFDYLQIKKRQWDTLDQALSLEWHLSITDYTLKSGINSLLHGNII